MFPIFDVVVLVFVFSCTYMMFRTGIYWVIATALAGVFVQQLVKLWMSQGGGVSSYATFFGGAVISSALIVGLFVFYFSFICKFYRLKLINQLCGLVAGGLCSLVFVSAVMLPVAYKAAEPISKTIASSYTVSHVMPWVQELFPATQARIIGKINNLIPSPPPPADNKRETQKKRGATLKSPVPADEDIPAPAE